jgi:hypothetical protein
VLKSARTAYLDYLISFYHSLTDVTVFLQDDALIPYQNPDHSGIKHTPLHNVSQLETVTRRGFANNRIGFVDSDGASPAGFLHYGSLTMLEAFGIDNYHGRALFALWPFFATADTPEPPETFTFKPAACFAVRKERILQRSLATYQGLTAHIYYSSFTKKQNDKDNWIGNERQYCCAMERIWHVLFGEPPILPTKSMITTYMN